MRISASRVRFAGALSALALGVIVTSCAGSGPSMDIQRETADQATRSSSGQTRRQAASAAAAARPGDFQIAAFARAVVEIPRGTVYLSYIKDEAVCGALNLVNTTTVERWRRGAIDLEEREGELAELFYEAIRSRGLPTPDTGETLFDQQSASSAPYAVAAVVKSIRLEICDIRSTWDGRRLGRMRGEGNITVQWQVYSRIRQRVVLRTETTGYGYIDDPVPDGDAVVTLDAFQDAARKLGDKPEYRRLLRAAAPAADARGNGADEPPLRVNNRGRLSGALTNNMDRVRGATVTVQVGGHGSGVIISPDGYILTNRHVVGSARQVRVITDDGTALIGDVVRADRSRDIALVKVDGRFPFLPIRRREARVGEDVYAIGTPLDRSLRTTVTTGVVSGVRETEGGLPFIQADADVQPGSSGGPLVDQSGNVVGLTVSGVQPAGGSIGVNFFIPIADGLRALNIRLR